MANSRGRILTWETERRSFAFRMPASLPPEAFPEAANVSEMPCPPQYEVWTPFLGLLWGLAPLCLSPSFPLSSHTELLVISPKGPSLLFHSLCGGRSLYLKCFFHLYPIPPTAGLLSFRAHVECHLLQEAFPHHLNSQDQTGWPSSLLMSSSELFPYPTAKHTLLYLWLFQLFIYTLSILRVKDSSYHLYSRYSGKMRKLLRQVGELHVTQLCLFASPEFTPRSAYLQTHPFPILCKTSPLHPTFP